MRQPVALPEAQPLGVGERRDEGLTLPVAQLLGEGAGEDGMAVPLGLCVAVWPPDAQALADAVRQPVALPEAQPLEEAVLQPLPL